MKPLSFENRCQDMQGQHVLLCNVTVGTAPCRACEDVGTAGTGQPGAEPGSTRAAGPQAFLFSSKASDTGNGVQSGAARGWLYGRCVAWGGVYISMLQLHGDAEPAPLCAAVAWWFLTSLGVQEMKELSSALCERGRKPLHLP